MKLPTVLPGFIAEAEAPGQVEAATRASIECAASVAAPPIPATSQFCDDVTRRKSPGRGAKRSATTLEGFRESVMTAAGVAGDESGARVDKELSGRCTLSCARAL